ncbi:hypothetical protein NIES2100_43090 [Calothrix sp. NIES-2100]|uniref:hypothetical protein n=1 Tax=Calothrix sp. NIES-2100 TaxID=1954172 RepID=UPI000B5E05CF|nr:hypothetical protein NIES2100_43090 [Calothrix sp. NIES-2100]
MIINDLNYFEDASEEVIGGDGFATNVAFNLNKNVKQTIVETTYKSFAVNTGGLAGNLAEVSGSADASGGQKNIAQIVFVTQTTAGAANALVNSTAYSGK